MYDNAALPPLRHARDSETSKIWNKVDQTETKQKEKRKKKSRILRTVNLKKGAATVSPCGEGFKEEGKGAKEEKPLRYCVFIAKHPVIAFVSTLVLHISVIVITISLMVTGHTVFPIEFDELPLILYTDIDRTQDLAWRDSMKYPYYVTRPVLGVTYPFWYNGRHGDTLEIIFEGDNIFSESNLKLLNETENRLYNIDLFQSYYCLMTNYLGACQKPISVMRLFDGTYSHVHAAFNQQSFANVSYVLCQATIFNETKEFVQLILENGYNPCVQGATSTSTRLFLIFGWPLLPTKASLSDYQVNKIRPEIENIRDNLLAGQMSLYYMSIKLFEYDVVEQSFADMKLAIGSFVFVFLFMLFQTASVWITFFGILSIFTSFLLTNLLYRFVFKFEYFGFFHIISIFIILGIGADDVFVFYDTWRLSGPKQFPSKAHRLSECYRKAAKTTFVTSLTTMSAFLVSAPSPLLPVSSFGIFSGLLVCVNYLFDLFCFPVVILVYSEAIKPIFDRIISHCKCCVKKKDLKKPERTYSQLSLVPSTPRGHIKKSYLQSITKLPTLSDDTSSQNSEDNRSEKEIVKKNFEDRNKIVLFLKNGFYDFMTKRAIRIGTPCLFFGLSIFFIHSATTIEPDSNQVEIFRESHNYGKAYKLHYYRFQRNYEDEKTRIHLSWGVKPQNMDACNLKSRDYCRGVTEWVDDFDASSEEAQVAIMNLCNRLDSLTDAEIDAYKIKRDAITNKPEIACFMSDMYKYYQNMATTSGINFPIPFPFTNTSVLMFMNYNSHIYDTTSLPVDFDRYLEIMISYWLSDGYQATSTADYWMYSRLIGEQKISGVTKVVNRPPAKAFGMVYGTKLKVIGIEINTTMSYFTLGYPEGKPVYEKWQKFIEEEVAKMPASLQKGFQSTLNTWHWIKVQETLVDSAVVGIAVGISLAFPILTFTTFNVVIGLLATVCIGMVTTIVVGIIPLAGWKLGVLESLNLCLVVGLSVDYVVHLAEAYRASPYGSREGRVKDMLESMGLSVLSGAITTFGAAIFMLFAKIKFLFQFGIFVMSTVGISLLFSFLFFTTFMALCGPQGNTGSLTVLFHSIKTRMTGSKTKNLKINGKDHNEDDDELSVTSLDDKRDLQTISPHVLASPDFMALHSEYDQQLDSTILEEGQGQRVTRRKTLAPIFENHLFAKGCENPPVIQNAIHEKINKNETGSDESETPRHNVKQTVNFHRPVVARIRLESITDTAEEVSVMESFLNKKTPRRNTLAPIVQNNLFNKTDTTNCTTTDSPFGIGQKSPQEQDEDAIENELFKF